MNSVKVVLLVRERDQGAILVLVPGLLPFTCSTYSFDIFHFFLFNLIWKILGPRFIYCFSYEKVVNNFCSRESKSEFAELRRNFRTKVLNVKLEAKTQKSRRCDELQIAEFIDSDFKVFLFLPFQS